MSCIMKKTRFASFLISVFSLGLVMLAMSAVDASPIASENAELVGAAIPSLSLDGFTSIEPEGEWSLPDKVSLTDSDNGTAISGKSPVSCRLDTYQACDGYLEVGVIVSASGRCTLTLGAEFDGYDGTVSVSSAVAASETTCIFVHIPDGARALTGLSLRAAFKSSANRSQTVNVRGIVLSSDDHISNIRNYSAAKLEQSGNVYIGQTVVSENAKNDIYAARLKIGGGSGNVTLSLSQNGKDYFTVGSTVLSPDRSEYLFEITDSPSPASYKLEFSGTSADVSLVGVDFIKLIVPESSASADLGRITKCTLSDECKTLIVSGTVTRDTAIEYIDSDICLFGVRTWESVAGVMLADPIATLKMSTSFTFTVPDIGDALMFSAYFTAIRSDDGYILLSDPEYPSCETPRSNFPTVSAYGITPAMAFASGFDGCVIDVNASDMLTSGTNLGNRVYTVNDSYFYLNSELLAQLDSTAEFLSRAGIAVVFRLDISDARLRNLSEHACKSVAASVSVLTERYSPSAIILCDNNKDRSYSAHDAKIFANMLRIATVAAGRTSVPVTIAAELTSARSDNAETRAWLLSHALSDLTRSQIRLIFTGVSANGTSLSEAKALANAASDGGVSFEYTLCFSISGDETQTVMSWLANSTVKTAALSIGDAASPALDPESYEAIRDVSYDSAHDGVLLWDFTHSYSTSGFSGSDTNAISTKSSRLLEEYTKIPDCRALTALLSSRSDLILASPERSLDLSSSPFVTFCIAAESDSPFSLDIFFISGDTRTLFTASFDGTGVYTPTCDLSGLGVAGRVDRIAIVLSEGEDVTLGIATVTSHGGDAEKLDDLYIPESTSPMPPEPDTIHAALDPTVFALIGCAVLTVIVFALLSIHREK